MVNIFSRNNIGNGLTIAVDNLPVRPDHYYRIEVAGFLGSTDGAIAHIRMQNAPNTVYETAMTQENGWFEFRHIFTYAEILELARRGQRLNIGGTASRPTMDIHYLMIIEICPGHVIFDIDNPYKNVEWGSYFQLKAALHAHSTNSDGQATVSQLSEEHYRQNFNIVMVSDHDILTHSPNLTPDSSSGGYQGLPQASLNETRMNEMRMGQGRPLGSSGMIFLPSGCEFSGPRGDNMNPSPSTLSSTADVHGIGVKAPIGAWANVSLAAWGLTTQNAGEGFLTVNHPGRNTGASRVATPPAITFQDAVLASNRSEMVNLYVNLFRTRRFYRAMEIINGIDTQSMGDRVLWDNILRVLAPEGIRVLGDSTDDSHALGTIGFAWNVMLMPVLNHDEARYALQSGQFFGFTRRDRQYGISPFGLNPNDNYANAQEDIRQLPIPMIRSIVCRRDMIAIEAENYEEIVWIADGVEIARGDTLDLFACQNNINGYVRAVVIHSLYGVLYTQPFLTRRLNTSRIPPAITAVRPLSAVANVPAPEVIDALGLQLPFGGAIETDTAGVLPMPIRWNLEPSELNYDPNNPNDQTFTVSGLIQLIGVENPNNISLSVSVQVTVLGNEAPIMFVRSWTVQPPDRNVTRVGEGSHIIKLSNIDPLWIAENAGNRTLQILYGEGQNAGSGRRFIAWTDLGAALAGVNPESIGWLDTTTTVGDGTANLTRPGRRGSALAATDISTSITIPAAQLRSGDTFATTLYVTITTNTNTNINQVGQHRGAAEASRLGTVNLN
jgi:hypothetical protein